MQGRRGGGWGWGRGGGPEGVEVGGVVQGRDAGGVRGAIVFGWRPGEWRE